MPVKKFLHSLYICSTEKPLILISAALPCTCCELGDPPTALLWASHLYPEFMYIGTPTISLTSCNLDINSLSTLHFPQHLQANSSVVKFLLNLMFNTSYMFVQDFFPNNCFNSVYTY